MGHNISALVVRDRCDPAAAAAVGLVPVALAQGLTLLHVDHAYSLYWQTVRGLTGELEVTSDIPSWFPREVVLAVIAAEITGDPSPIFALIMTDYFGGMGTQWACAYRGQALLPAEQSISAALRCLGVKREPGLDEFDSVGLSKHRSQPDHLGRYGELCEELGV